MRHVEYFYKCSPEYIDAIDPSLRDGLIDVVSTLRKRETQLELNQDLAWLLGLSGWSFACFPQSMPETPPPDLGMASVDRHLLEARRDRTACLASTILEHRWVIDFCKTFARNRVYLEVQFGKKEAVLMDFCKLRIAYYEKHLSLGIEMVLVDPTGFFAHRRAAVSGMARFSVAKEILPIIGLECPIWLIGLSD